MLLNISETEREILEKLLDKEIKQTTPPDPYLGKLAKLDCKIARLNRTIKKPLEFEDEKNSPCVRS